MFKLNSFRFLTDSIRDRIDSSLVPVSCLHKIKYFDFIKYSDSFSEEISTGTPFKIFVEVFAFLNSQNFGSLP